MLTAFKSPVNTNEVSKFTEGLGSQTLNKERLWSVEILDTDYL